MLTQTYPLDAVNDAMDDLDAGRLRGRGILVPDAAGPWSGRQTSLAGWSRGCRLPAGPCRKRCPYTRMPRSAAVLPVGNVAGKPLSAWSG